MAGIVLLALTAISCGGAAPAGQAEPVTVEVTRIVEQPGPEVTREVEVEVTRIVEQPGAEVTREVPVEVTRVVRESAPADDPGKLIIYSGRSESLVDPIIQQFKGATGIDVQVKYAGTAALAATLLEEGENSPADVFYAQDPGGLAAVSEMMTELPDDIIELTPEWVRSGQGRWVGITGRARVVVYGTDNLTEADLPDDLWGFAEPEWKGRVGWAPTNGSFQAMVTALRVGWGEERTEEWLRAMIDNDVQIYPKNTPQVAAAAAGEIDVGLVNHYYLYRFLAEEGEDFPARNAHLRGGGPGAIVMVSGAGILETADNPENAEAFIRFLLSAVGQQYFAGQTFEYPMVEGVRPSVLLTPLGEIEQPYITLADLSDLAGTQALLQKTGALP
ncbi:MAG: iron ABC transporter substrate-binding protein [Chloroflexi bacterium]|nr:iron ABC transporter substrate-binding protein [Chloroflexota bacterium]